ncbi:MAG: hypothetical protein D4R68_06165 [Ignavibacteriales bacterium]|nr:MAG: hypothetical protein D4R68_06165 [Ignavibacteriales bacterium]
MKKILYIRLISFSFSFLALQQITAQDNLKPFKTDKPPIIDGNLNDQLWKDALSVSGFKTFAPDFGKEGTERTIAYAAYDSENLYFAFRCYDRDPSKIKSSVSNRDNIRPDDWVCINLDSFNDQQSLYAFYVNPLGIQMDSRFASGQEDVSADFVWYSGGQKLSDGYSVEISIPLKSIRYSEGNPVTMSIFFERYISRFSEHDSYPELDPAKGFAFLTQMMPLVYYDLKHYTLFEVLPAFTYNQKYNLNAGQLEKNVNQGEISLTTKYGITSDLILDGTYNPDFSQIEADAGQVDVNLRYQLYFPEKRPFFLEGNEIYNIAATKSSEIDPLISLVHTRTIINPLTGIKLSGKVSSNNTIAFMFAVDRLSSDMTALSGDYSYVPILRYKRSLSDDSYIGGVFTDREIKNSYDRVLGIDGMLRLTDASTLEWNAFYSSSKSNLLQEIQGGRALGLVYNYDSRNLFYSFTGKEISENFNAAAGYLTRTGIFALTGLVRPKIYPNSSFIQRIDLETFSAQTQDKPSSMWETYNYVSAQAFFLGSWNFKLKYSYATEIFLTGKFNTGGFQISFGSQFTKQFAVSLSYKRINSIYYSQNPYQGKSNRISAIMVYNLSENFESYSTFTFSDFYRDSDSQLIYEYPIFHERLTYQLNKYLFFRGIVEYNKYKRQLLTDFLVSFTYVPGTVIHLGYGSLYQRTEWNEFQNRYVDSNNFLEAQRGFFFKMSYLWRN